MTARCSICGRNRPANQMVKYRIQRNTPSGIGYMFKCPEHNPIEEPFRFSPVYSPEHNDYLKRWDKAGKPLCSVCGKKAHRQTGDGKWYCMQHGIR